VDADLLAEMAAAAGFDESPKGPGKGKN